MDTYNLKNVILRQKIKANKVLHPSSGVTLIYLKYVL